MEQQHDVKLGMTDSQKIQEAFKLEKTLSDEQSPKMSSIQSKRRFMITDILNSAVESANHEPKGLDMRLLFPGVTRFPENFSKLHPSVGSDVEGDSDVDDDQEDGDDKGEQK